MRSLEVYIRTIHVNQEYQSEPIKLQSEYTQTIERSVQLST